MSLPGKFDRQVKRGLGLRAVWPPGDPVEIGDVMTRQNGIFRPIDNLANFGVEMVLQQFPDQRSLNFQASGTSTTIIQGGAEIDPTQIDADVAAKVVVEFGKGDSYFIRTSELGGVEIEDVRSVARQLRDHPEWRHGKYSIAWQLYLAESFTCLGTTQKNRKISFSGKGRAVLKFLTVGATAGLTRTSSSAVSVDLAGKRGPIAMAVLRVRKDGEVVFG